MKNINEIEFEDNYYSDENSHINTDEKIFKIRYWNTTYTYERIAELYKRNIFVIPDIQRTFVWSSEMASRLIESILLGIPLPNFFIYKNDDESNDIIDGLQRIITISTFINGESFPGKKTKFKIANSNNISAKWRGKSFDELTIEEQDRIKDGEATIVFFEQRFPNRNENDIKQHVFERINTGGVKLSSQEIRNALFPGELKDKIKQIADKWKEEEKRFSTLDYKKYKIDELILRILTVEYIVNENFYGFKKIEDNKFEKYKITSSITLKSQMDYFMEKFKNGYDDIVIFEKALVYYYENNNDINYLGKVKNKINAVYTEALFIILMHKIRNGKTMDLNKINFLKLKEYIKNQNEPFTNRTTNLENLIKRIDIFDEVFGD